MSESEANKEAILKEVKELIAKNKTSDALKLLSKSQFSTVDKELIMLNSRYNKIKEEENLGTASEDQISRKLNKLKLAIVDVAEKVNMKPEELAALTKMGASKTKSSKKSKSGSGGAVPWTLVGVIGTILALLLLFILWPTSDEELDGGEDTEMMDDASDDSEETYSPNDESDYSDDGEEDGGEDEGMEGGEEDGGDGDY